MKPGCPSTACSRLANLFSSSGPAPSGTSIALIFTTAMTPRLTAMRRSVLRSDGLELAVVEFVGQGPPILLLHGLMGRATTWWPVAQWLTGYGRVLGVDARGHGRSDARGPWTTGRMTADAAELLADVGPGVVIGHSMGGLHGLVLAARHPELVRALVVEDMGVDFRGRSVEEARAWF